MFQALFYEGGLSLNNRQKSRGFIFYWKRQTISNEHNKEVNDKCWKMLSAKKKKHDRVG